MEQSSDDQLPNNESGLGVSAKVARYFVRSRLTLLFVLASLMVGVFSFLVTPREEEPQVSRAIVDVVIPFPGASAKSVERMVVNPAEQLLARSPGLDHIFSTADAGIAVISMLFETGVSKVDALVHTNNVIASNTGWLSAELGVLEPIISAKDNDDVAVFSLLLHAENETVDLAALQSIAHSLEKEFKRVPGTREVTTIGGASRSITVSVDPVRLRAHDISLQEIEAVIRSANDRSIAGELVRSNNYFKVSAGRFFSELEDLEKLVVKVVDGQPVFLSEVAQLDEGATQPAHYLWYGEGEGEGVEDVRNNQYETYKDRPSVVVSVTKQSGENVAQLVEQLLQRSAELENTLIPSNVTATVVRNNGEVANAKIEMLMTKIVLVLASVALLIFFALGGRESLVVLAVLLITLSLTFFATLLLGFTLNSSSLFAMVVSIGLLADDAVVVVENIHRYRSKYPRSELRELVPKAVHEIGGATILATFAVVVALMPMAVLTGVVGEFFRPIPVITSVGMVLSLIVAFVVSPWLATLWMKPVDGVANGEQAKKTLAARLGPLFTSSFGPLVDDRHGSRNRRLLSVIVIVAMAIAIAAVLMQKVSFRLQPLDNRAEVFVVIDMPTGSPLERTAAVTKEMTDVLRGIAEVKDYQAYVGMAAPMDPTGLIRKYYLRAKPEQAQILVNLVAKKKRKKKSGEVVEDVRAALTDIARKAGADFTVYDPPSGTPFQALIVAEIYGPSESGRKALESSVKERFDAIEGLVDVDTSVELSAQQVSLLIDQSKAKVAGVAVADITSTLSTALNGRSISYLHGNSKYPAPIELQLASDQKGDLRTVLNLPLRGESGQLVMLSELLEVQALEDDQPIFHKDLLPYHFVTAEIDSRVRSPIWVVSEVGRSFDDLAVPGGGDLRQNFTSDPAEPYKHYSVRWDGEWMLTYETITELGVVYIVGLLLIYVLIVGKFGSYLVPMIIMVPIPLTLIGQVAGHYLVDTEITVTSVIGMLVLAGLIVRNSILLVDFIETRIEEGVALKAAVIESANIRAQPIILTSLTAMVAALFLLDDPVFNGLAVALIFGNLVSTALTLVVIPTLYYAVFHRSEQVST